MLVKKIMISMLCIVGSTFSVSLLSGTPVITNNCALCKMKCMNGKQCYCGKCIKNEEIISIKPVYSEQMAAYQKQQLQEARDKMREQRKMQAREAQEKRERGEQMAKENPALAEQLRVECEKDYDLKQQERPQGRIYFKAMTLTDAQKQEMKAKRVRACVINKIAETAPAMAEMSMPAQEQQPMTPDVATL